MGDVEAETLIKKLVKTGKHAELWPEKAESKEKKKSKGKKKEKQSDTESSKESNHGDDKEKGTVKVEAQAHDSAKNNGGGNTSKNGDVGNVNKPTSEGGKPGKQGDGGGHVKESKSEVKTVTLPAGSQTAVAEKKTVVEIEGGTESSAGGAQGSGGSGGKKKKKKGQKGNSNGNEVQQNIDGAAPSTGSPIHAHGPNSLGTGQNPALANQALPRHYEHQYPPQHYYAPPVYAVGYNTTHPTSSYTTSHYASPPPYSYSYSYAPMHHGPGSEMEPSPYYVDSYSSQPSDSFELFSDENPNGCFIM